MCPMHIAMSTDNPDIDAIWQGLVAGLGITNAEQSRQLRNVFILGFSSNFICLESIAKCAELSEPGKSEAIFNLRRECQSKVHLALDELRGSKAPAPDGVANGAPRRRPLRGKRRS